MRATHLGRYDRRRKVYDLFMRSLVCLGAAIAIVPLLFVLYYVSSRAIPSLNVDFFVKLPVPVGEEGGGMANAIVGTLKLLFVASMIGIPWGIFIGVFLSEYRESRFVNQIRFLMDLFTSVPSIIVGLFAYGLIVINMGSFSTIAGGFALSVIMVPIIGRSTEELLRLTPQHIREAGLALGLSRRKVILNIVLKGSIQPITTGIMLALARASGETAPLLFTALNNSYWSSGFLEPISSLPVQIYTYSISPYEEWQNQAWVGAFVLVFLVFSVNILTRLMLKSRQ